MIATPNLWTTLSRSFLSHTLRVFLQLMGSLVTQRLLFQSAFSCHVNRTITHIIVAHTAALCMIIGDLPSPLFLET